MRTIPVITLLLVGLAVFGPARADEATGFYLGGSIGQSDFKDACEGLSSCDDSDTAWKAFAGYSFNQYFGVEGGYIDFGEVTGSDAGVTGSVEGTGITAHAVGSIPIWNGLSLIGRIGAVFWDAEASLTSGATTLEASDDGISLAVGAGVQWMFGRNFGLRAEYELFDGIGDDSTTGESDIHVISAGIVFKF
jgi:OOP family OmpA-OmpF porin